MPQPAVRGEEICPRNCSRAEPPESKSRRKTLRASRGSSTASRRSLSCRISAGCIALRAQFERFSSAFEQVDDLFAAFIDCAALLNGSYPAIRVHDQHKLRFRKNRDIRVVRDEDHLPAFLHALHRIHYGFKNEVIVQVVLRLIDNQRVIPSRQKYREQVPYTFARGKDRMHP